MIVSKNSVVNVNLDLDDFLNERLCSSPFKRDLYLAANYYSILEEMKREASDLINVAYDLEQVDNCFQGDCLFVDSDGVAKGRIVDYKEIKQFVDYINKEYDMR